MEKILFSIKAFAFWGIVFFLVLVVGFGVNTGTIFSIAVSIELPCSIYCWYILISIVLYPVLMFITNRKTGLSLHEIGSTHLYPILWIPYKGFDIRGLFKIKTLDTDFKGKVSEAVALVFRFIETVIWWGVLVSGVLLFKKNENNLVYQAVKTKSPFQILLILGVSIGIYLVLLLISWLLFKSTIKKWKEDFVPKKVSLGTNAQQYYDRHPEKIPVGCRACGGPYPECRSSCNLFDE